MIREMMKIYLKSAMKTISEFNCALCCVLILIGASKALIASAYSNNLNGTTLIYANPYDPALPPGASKRTARRGGSLANGCTTTEGASGTCMSRFNCMRRGGTVKGSCPTYGGICCETNLQCGDTSKLKRTIIRNPAQLTVDDCLYVIEPYSSNVCQLLVEFDSFDLQPPVHDQLNSMLECVDYLELGDYTLCGKNDRQHLYLQFNVAGGIRNVPLNFHIPSRWSQSSWRLVITQLECPAVKRRLNLSFLPFITDNSLQDARTVFSPHHNDMDILAPPGCDQYFRETTGTIQSFNYNENIQTYYMPNLHYVICIKPMPGSSVIEYTLRKFSLAIHANAQNAYGFDHECRTYVPTPGRFEDYLMIPQSTYSIFGATPNYYCGLLPDRSVVTASLPYIMYFNSDDTTDIRETGFILDYRVKSVLG